MKPLSTRALTGYYILALLIIAGLSITSHIVMATVLQDDQGSAYVLNMSGRQRMLSQRIASLAAQYRMGDTTARDALLAAVSSFEAAHSALSRAEGHGGPPVSPAAAASLNAEVGRFVANARQVANLPPADPAALPALTSLFAEARAPLLQTLDGVVSGHQRESENIFRRLASLQWIILSVVLLTLLVEALAIFRPMIRRITSFTSEMLHLVTTDALTGAVNRQSFIDRAELELARSRRYDRPLSLMMLDADHFKLINDTYGHGAGDATLRALGGALRQSLRTTDAIGRLGGEEFAVLLAETDLPGAAELGERLRSQIANLAVPYGEHSLSVTVSIGVTSLPREVATVEQALRAADSFMYRAKAGGRNRVVSGEYFKA
jgi:diguanylate cyclase (GGDEF)-like protein